MWLQSNILAIVGTLIMLCIRESLTTLVNHGNPAECVQAYLGSVRIGNCSAEPCKIKRRVHVPVEIDFDFENPDKTDGIAFIVIISSGNGTIPGVFQDGSKISVLAHEIECPKLGISECPAVAGKQYTMKSTIYVDPDSDESFTMGVRESGWLLSPTISWFYPQYSMCYFSVSLDISDNDEEINDI